jgi:hypothetical protein
MLLCSFHVYVFIFDHKKKKIIFVLYILCYCLFVVLFDFYVSYLNLNLGLFFIIPLHNSCASNILYKLGGRRVNLIIINDC